MPIASTLNSPLPTIVSLYGHPALGSIKWTIYVREPSSILRNDVRVGLYVLAGSSDLATSKRDLFRSMRESLKDPDRDAWLRLDGERWLIDCDGLRQSYPELRDNPNFDWLRGSTAAEPEYEIEDEIYDGEMSYARSLAFDITPEALKVHISKAAHPVEISESLARFRKDHPDPSKVAFIMMKLGERVRTPE
jgi:hypothetical protein